jgi:hypothetical protein
LLRASKAKVTSTSAYASRSLTQEFSTNETEVVDYILKTFPDVEKTTNFGYEMFFYKSDRKLSFATMLSSDYEYDDISNLSRPGVFRLNVGGSKETFQALFGADEVDVNNYDFAALDVIMPTPSTRNIITSVCCRRVRQPLRGCGLC